MRAFHINSGTKKSANGTGKEHHNNHSGGGKDLEPVLITGGAGFIGSNIANRLLSNGRKVRVLDNLSRAGVERNLRWLRSKYPDQLDVRLGDVQDQAALRAALAGVTTVFHLAAQVAVTTSIESPEEDFSGNLLGTFRLLEEVRRLSRPTRILYTSTNKVYGDCGNTDLVATGKRYTPRDPAFATQGYGESTPLSFCSPYGCSKGAADQYVLDDARTYSVPAAVFRMSCIYGPRQFGTEDQGWVAHFLLQALASRPITIFGDGRQVRDVLYVEDLVDLFLLAEDRMESIAGEAFNVGGGPRNAISLLDLLETIESLHGARPRLEFGEWRIGDQRYYVSDISKAARLLGWAPRVTFDKGIRRLYDWLCEERQRTSVPTAVSSQAGLLAAEHA